MVGGLVTWIPSIYPKSGWWFGTFGKMPNFVGMMIQSDEFIFFRGVGQPPTS